MTTTTAKEWREKRKSIEFELPEYKDTVLIRPMDAGFFFKTGRIPDFLAKTVSDLINRISTQVEIPKELTPDETKQWLTFLDELAKWTIVSPKVVDDPQADDEIGVDEITLVDKLYLYQFFGQPASILRSFRPKWSTALATVDAAKNNGTHAVETVGSPALGQPDTGDA